MRSVVKLICYISLLFYCLFHNVIAVEMKGLYEIQVPYDTVSFRSSKAAQKLALSKVLVRLIGPEKGVIDTLIRDYFPDPSRFIRQFEPHQNGDLIVSMDGDAIQQMLLQTDNSVWGTERPLTILLIAIDEGMGERVVLTSDGFEQEWQGSTNIDKYRVMKQKMTLIANIRGIPIIFPKMDIQDQSTVDYSDIWGDFFKNMNILSQRYESTVILTGKIRQDELEQNSWALNIGNEITRFRASPEQAINYLADNLLTRYSYSGRVPAKEIQLKIHGIKSINDVGDVYLSLNNLSMIEKFIMSDVNENSAQYLLSYNGFIDDLIASLNNSDIFEVSDTIKYQYKSKEKRILEYKLIRN